MKTVRIAAHADETVDALVWRALGSRGGIVEAVLDVNPGLAGLGPLLPAGTIVDVPLPGKPAAQTPLVQLWS